MRYSLRTLLILMLLAGPLGAWGWKEWQALCARRALEESKLQARKGGFTTITGTGFSRKTPIPSPAADEIWLQQRDSIRWESFPESQPTTP